MKVIFRLILICFVLLPATLFSNEKSDSTSQEPSWKNVTWMAGINGGYGLSLKNTSQIAPVGINVRLLQDNLLFSGVLRYDIPGNYLDLVAGIGYKIVKDRFLLYAEGNIGFGKGLSGPFVSIVPGEIPHIFDFEIGASIGGDILILQNLSVGMKVSYLFLPFLNMMPFSNSPLFAFDHFLFGEISVNYCF